MTKVYLSPSSQTENLYAWGGTNEAAQCRAIAAACEAALKRSGFDVRTGAGTMYTRVPESNAWGAALHVAIHTNAANGKTTGTRCYAYRDGGDGFRAARAIFDKLAPITPGASEGVFVQKTWYEIVRTKAPCAYVECEFTDRNGKRMLLQAHELLAICIQHELDHLDGVLFIDKAQTLSPKAKEKPTDVVK